MSLCCPECGAFFTEILSPLPGDGDAAAPFIVRFYCRRCQVEAFYDLAKCLFRGPRRGLILCQRARTKKKETDDAPKIQPVATLA